VWDHNVDSQVIIRKSFTLWILNCAIFIFESIPDIASHQISLTIKSVTLYQ